MPPNNQNNNPFSGLNGNIGISSTGNWQSLPITSQQIRTALNSMTDNDIRLVIFYGFGGILNKRFSIIEIESKELEARMAVAMVGVNPADVPWAIFPYSTFHNMFNMFVGTPNALLEIHFEDALEIIKNSAVPTDIEEYEEPEEDEFGDNCTPACKPGNHQHLPLSTI